MDEDEIVERVGAQPGVVVFVASDANGSPQAAWGDTFFFYDPDDRDEDRRIPFATIVTNDYDGFDEVSQLHRPGVFRVNLHLGRELFTELLSDRDDESIDYAELDVLFPHPYYGPQGWVSIVCPGEGTRELVPALIEDAYARAVERHERRR